MSDEQGYVIPSRYFTGPHHDKSSDSIRGITVTNRDEAHCLHKSMRKSSSKVGQVCQYSQGCAVYKSNNTSHGEWQHLNISLASRGPSKKPIQPENILTTTAYCITPPSLIHNNHPTPQQNRGQRHTQRMTNQITTAVKTPIPCDHMRIFGAYELGASKSGTGREDSMPPGALRCTSQKAEREGNGR